MGTHLENQRQQIDSDARFGIVHDIVCSFVDGFSQRPIHAKELALVAEMLPSLPLATDQHDLANRRLANAHRYLDSGEFGAARYELRLLLGMLSPPPAMEPKRRKR